MSSAALALRHSLYLSCWLGFCLIRAASWLTKSEMGVLAPPLSGAQRLAILVFLIKTGTQVHCRFKGDYKMEWKESLAKESGAQCPSLGFRGNEHLLRTNHVLGTMPKTIPCSQGA